jgi:hypothetical protein
MVGIGTNINSLSLALALDSDDFLSSLLLLSIFRFPQNKKNENEKIQKNISKNIRKKSKK